jgi:hypothetical protein
LPRQESALWNRECHRAGQLKPRNLNKRLEHKTPQRQDIDRERDLISQRESSHVSAYTPCSKQLLPQPQSTSPSASPRPHSFPSSN